MPTRKAKRKAFQPPKTKTTKTEKKTEKKTEMKTETKTETKTKTEVDGCSETVTPVTTLTTEGDLELPSKVCIRLSNVQGNESNGTFF